MALLAGAGRRPDEAGPVTLTVGFGQDVDTFNPAIGAARDRLRGLEPPVRDADRQGGDDFQTIPGLATSWKSSNHGKTWTYTLRPNLKWSDGYR